MTPAQFRKLAQSQPEIVEGSHMGTTDFRANGRIVATVGAPDAAWGMLKLTLEQQAMVCESQPKVFEPCQGGWGRMGYTGVKLAAARVPQVREVLLLAIQNSMEKPTAKGRKKSSSRTTGRKRGSGSSDTK